MSKTELKELFKKYLEDDLSPEEFSRLYEIVRSGYDAAALDELLENAFSDPAWKVRRGDFEPKAVFALIQAKIAAKEVAEPIPARVVPLYPRRRIALAASIV